MALPLERQRADVPEAPGGQRDGLSTGEDGLDNVRRQERELDIVPDVSGIDAVPLG